MSDKRIHVKYFKVNDAAKLVTKEMNKFFFSHHSHPRSDMLLLLFHQTQRALGCTQFNESTTTPDWNGQQRESRRGFSYGCIPLLDPQQPPSGQQPSDFPAFGELN